MSVQTDDLVMLGLGSLHDHPPNAIQPALADGIHLRIAFAPERGFPWYGYYLFRRRSQKRTPSCLGPDFKPEWKPGPWPNSRADFVRGSFSSDVRLVFSDQFAPAGRAEFDLQRRKYLRFELPPTQSACEFHVTLGMLGTKPAPETRCVDFSRLKPGVIKNPVEVGKVTFNVMENDGAPRKNGEIRMFGAVAGLVLQTRMAATLPNPASSVEVQILSSDSAAQIRALDVKGNAVDTRPVVSAPRKVQTIRLAGAGITSVQFTGTRTDVLLLRLCFTTDPPRQPLLGPIRLQAFDGPVPVATATISAAAGETATAVLAADTMTSVEIEGGPALLIDLCIVEPGSAGGNWNALLPQPLCLPVEHAAYPCPGKPATLAQAESMALGRIQYGHAADWSGQPFADLNHVLTHLVALGPTGPPMAECTMSYPAVPAPGAPAMPFTSPLDVLLVGSLHPAVAMMLGLYFVDSATPPGLPYDYMVVADHGGRFHGNPAEVLTALAAVTPTAPLPADVDVAMTFNKKRESSPPLPPPAAPEVFALPGAITGTSLTPAARNMAGLRWTIDAAADGTVLPGGPIGYHLWRFDVGANQPTAAPDPNSYNLLTADRLIIATESSLPTGATVERASDWPPFPLMAFDSGLVDGWYSYRLSSGDIFGRHSARSGTGPWLQWMPPPDPKPWYYIDPPADRQINPFAVRLIDTSPPPAPPGVEAAALDPRDPMLLKDAAYAAWFGDGTSTDWWNSSNDGDRAQRLGLRVSWRWTIDQMTQAPDTAEFRIYFYPHIDPPLPDRSDPLNWAERVYVVAYANYAALSTDANGDPVRLYDVLLPVVSPIVAGGSIFAGVPLAASEAEPVVYAHVGVSAADDKAYTADKWTTGAWGNRPGNEGRVGTPAKIYRVLRDPPPAPPAIDDSDKVWATRADYHSRSYYTFRWASNAALKAHIFRALDETLFQTDYALRPRAALSSVTPNPFPVASWDANVRAAIATALDALNSLPLVAGTDSDTVKKSKTDTAMAAYRALSNNALRVLAGLSGNEKAFSQITYIPLDPADGVNADRAGPDGSDAYQPSAALRAYQAELDGRASNRYFFRAAYVNAALTAGPLGPSSPPVYLPKVAPPRTPVITKVLGGDRAITLTWASNREPDVAEYRVYRTDDERKARDIRAMDLVATVAETQTDPALRPKELDWTDAGVAPLKSWHYRVTSRDNAQNESAPTTISIGKAFDIAPPPPPTWIDAQWIDQAGTLVVALSWNPVTAGTDVMVQRREFRPTDPWRDISQWLNTSQSTWVDAGARPYLGYTYRLRARSAAGNTNVTWSEFDVASFF
jgi:hypothetical protein